MPSVDNSLEQKRGKFKFKASGGGGQLSRVLFERINEAEWVSELDKSDFVRLRIALHKKEALELRLSELPPELSLDWQDRPIFKGGLVSARTVGHSALELLYRDKLFALERVIDGSHLKSESLSSALKNIAGKAKLDARFYGDFGETLPTVYLGGKSLFENLSFLAAKFGFFFYFHGPSGLVHFMRLGSSSATVNIDVKKSVTDLRSSLRSDLSWDGVETRVFDDRDLSTQTRKVSGQNLYSSLSSLSEHAGYRTKQNWPFASGNFEIHAQNAGEYEDGDRRVKNPLAKQAAFQESVILSAYEPLGLPGDQVQLKNSWTPELYDGKFLLHRCHADFSSSLPKVEMTLIRP